MRFLRLQVQNWRNFKKADIPLQRRAFIAGPNASGKSNLLDALRFLSEVAAVQGGLQYAVQKRHGVSKIRCLSARRYPDIGFRVEIGDNSGRPEWVYQIAINQDNNSRPVLREEVVSQQDREILRRPDDLDTADPERLTQTHLEQVSANRGFREIADFLASIRYLHIVPQLVREPDRYVGRSSDSRQAGRVGDPYGGDFLEQIAGTPRATLNSRLAKITQALQIAVPQLEDLRLDRDDRGTPHLRGLYKHWRPDAGWQGEDQFSDGTLRLLGLLWSSLEGTGPLLLEEPELSLHPEVVRHIPQMIARLVRKSRRQILISTHSSSLLEDPGIDPDEVILLIPSDDGTEVVTASHDQQVVALLDGGETMAAAVLPRTSPKNADQLSLFADF